MVGYLERNYCRLLQNDIPFKKLDGSSTLITMDYFSILCLRKLKLCLSGLNHQWCVWNASFAHREVEISPNCVIVLVAEVRYTSPFHCKCNLPPNNHQCERTIDRVVSQSTCLNWQYVQSNHWEAMPLQRGRTRYLLQVVGFRSIPSDSLSFGAWTFSSNDLQWSTQRSRPLKRWGSRLCLIDTYP